jgi:iron(III) transport system substrate-binding protein
VKSAGRGALVLLAGLWVGAGASAGCGAPDRDQDVLVVYSAGPRSLAEAVTEAFAEEHGVRVELFAATTGQVMARIEAERYRPRADVVVFASRVAAESLKANNRLLRYENPPWLDRTRTSWHDPEGYFYSTSAALVGMAFRGAAAPSARPDPDWSDVFEGRFGGRLTLPAPSRSGAAGDFVVAYTLREGDGAWREYLTARQGGLDISAANSQAISGLLTGAYDGIVGAVDYLIFGQIERGAELRVHYPRSGSALVERPVAILLDTPVPDLARRFVDFYLSEGSQAMVAEAHLLPARLDVSMSPIRVATMQVLATSTAAEGNPAAADRDAPRDPGVDLPPLILVDHAEALRQQTRILRRFQLEVERAEVVRPAR